MLLGRQTTYVHERSWAPCATHLLWEDIGSGTMCSSGRTKLPYRRLYVAEFSYDFTTTCELPQRNKADEVR